MVTGLGVRLFPSGRASWVIRYRVNPGRRGRQRIHSFGPVGILTPADACEMGRALLVEVLRGNDPAERKAERIEALTFGELCTGPLEARADKRSTQDDRPRARDHLIPSLGQRLAIEIARPDVVRLHNRIADEYDGATSNRVLASTSAIFSWAERSGAAPLGHVDPARGGVRKKEVSRDRWLKPEEVRRVLIALEEHPSVFVRGVIWLVFLTGMRKGEALTGC